MMHMGDPLRFDGDDWGKLWSTIQRSFSINRHVEFFRWLQDEVHWCLPHDVLVAAWGDFSNGRLNYDVASSVPEIHTQQIIDGCGIDPLMCHLYHRWRSGGEQGYVLNTPCLADINRDKSDTCLTKLDQMKSVLVHGIRDRRGNNDCLYVFFDRKTRVLDNQPILELLLPQIDAALRRVECLTPAAIEEPANNAQMYGISDREHEIMQWVKLGKTNYEIGVILGISPNTVKSHLRRIFHKLNVFNRAQAVAKYEMHRPLVDDGNPVYDQPESGSGYWAAN